MSMMFETSRSAGTSPAWCHFIHAMGFALVVDALCIFWLVSPGTALVLTDAIAALCFFAALRARVQKKFLASMMLFIQAMFAIAGSSVLFFPDQWLVSLASAFVALILFTMAVRDSVRHGHEKDRLRWREGGSDADL